MVKVRLEIESDEFVEQIISEMVDQNYPTPPVSCVIEDRNEAIEKVEEETREELDNWVDNWGCVTISMEIDLKTMSGTFKLVKPED